MEKAVEIKRRAQRCVQNGDLDGAISEYEKLADAADTDPYTYVLIADLLYKKGDQEQAAARYLEAAAAYEKTGLYKNGIAVCKKLLRLSLAPGTTLKRLAALHALDGLGAEAALYYMQYAEQMVRASEYDNAAEALQKAWNASNDQVKALERLAEVQVLREDKSAAARALLEASQHYARNGQLAASEQCRSRAREMDATASLDEEPPAKPSAGAANSSDAGTRGMGGAVPERVVDLDAARTEEAGDDGGADAPGDDSDDADAFGLETEVQENEAARTVPGFGRADIESGYGDDADGDTGSPGIPQLETVETRWSSATPPAPGLRFDAPGGTAAERGTRGLSEVEKLLAEAQQHFKSGDRDAASATLVRAAETYESHGHLDAAASIWRSLGKSAQAAGSVLERWYANCERREDATEAAHVACELGDRALNEDRRADAEAWFSRALQQDEGNELAKRRLARLTGKAPAANPEAALPGINGAAPETPGAPADEPAEAEAAAPAPPSPEKGRVELAVGRGEAVSFDLGSLISEFQRGVEAQLSGDTQSHYDLGMAYREMGLLEQAVDAFRQAAGDAAFADRCTEMIGRCLLDQGRFEEAAAEFSAAIASGRLDPDTQVSIRYQLGLALEAAGRMDEALTEFEGVYARQPNFPDVAMKIRVLKTSAGRSQG